MCGQNARAILGSEIRASGLEVVAAEEFRGFAGLKSPTTEGLVKRFFAREDNFAFSVAVALQETD